jgi:hypothetical protein
MRVLGGIGLHPKQWDRHLILLSANTSVTMTGMLYSLGNRPKRQRIEKEYRDMQAFVHPYMRRLSKPLAYVLALFALVFLLQLAPHTHANGHDEAACGLCQVGHVGVAPAVALPNLSVPFVSLGLIAGFTAFPLPEFFFEQSPSRAPPSFLA